MTTSTVRSHGAGTSSRPQRSLAPEVIGGGKRGALAPGTTRTGGRRRRAEGDVGWR